MPRAGVIAVLLVAATVAVYGQVGGFSFVDYDDDAYVFENEHVRNGLTVEGVRWAFTTGHQGNWHPLTWLSHMLDAELSGLDPTLHHVSSLVLHALNAVLLFALLLRATGRLWPSAVVAALFALHPLNVESVAWVAERKNVLSMMLGLLSALAYVSYARRRTLGFYLLSATLLALGLMAKPMLVTLPFVFLLMDYWPLERLRPRGGPQRFPAQPAGRLLLEKVPLLVLSAASAVTTLLVQSAGGAVVEAGATLPLGARLANALVSYVRYLRKTVWPDDLAIQYLHPAVPGGAPWTTGQVLGAAIVLLALTTAVALGARRRYLAVGWLWYVGTLVPVIGVVQVGEQAMADRYAYLPLIGIFLALVWAANDGLSAALARGRSARVGVAISSVALVVACGVASSRQARYWRDSLTLYERGLEVSPRSAFLHFNLGTVLDSLGRFEDAAGHYERALEIRPDRANAHWNLANALREQGRIDEAIVHYRRAAALDPQNALVQYDLANALRSRGDLDGAIESYRRCLAVRPGFAAAWNNLGNALSASGAIDDAIDALTEALRREPNLYEAQNNLGALSIRRGRTREALAHFREAARLAPDSAVPLMSAALILAATPDPAIRDPREATRLAESAAALTGRRDARVLDTLAVAQAASGQFDEAVGTAETALKLASADGQQALVAGIRSRLELYRKGLPFVDSFRTERADD